MKKLILAAFAVSTAVSVFAQGTVVFNNRVPNGTSHVWGPSSSNPGLSLVGAGSNDTVTTGTTPYAASGMSLIGAGGLNGKYGASTTVAQLLGANGASQLESSLTLATPTTTFRSGAASGNVALTTATLTGVPLDAPAATIEMVAWDDSTGLYPTWAQASIAWGEGLIAAGKSGTFNITQVGGSVNSPTPMAIPSFNLYFVPEPSTFALAGLGLAALVAFRRRNS